MNPFPMPMRALIFIHTLALLLIAGPASANALPEYSTGYDAKRDVFADGHDAIQRAKASNRRVLIEVGGDWCVWCHVLDKFLRDNPDIETELHNTFVLLKVNVDDVNDNSEFLKAFPKPLGYPHMYITENTGSIVWSQDTAEFLHKGKYSRERFLAFLHKWKLPDAK